MSSCAVRSFLWRYQYGWRHAIFFVCLFPLVISVLASLNLPAAIEDLSGQTVPKSMLDKSAAVIEKGGLQALDTYMQDLPELLQRNREILDEVRTCWEELKLQLRANGRTNSQHCWGNNVGSCCCLVRCGVQTGVATPSSSSTEGLLIG